jgi:hypothetical protein
MHGTMSWKLRRILAYLPLWQTKLSVRRLLLDAGVTQAWCHSQSKLVAGYYVDAILPFCQVMTFPGAGQE